MCEKNDLQLSLSGDTFQALKADFDSILARTLGNMTMKGASEATLTLKLSIELKNVNVGSYDDLKEITKPTFKHDISSVMQVKDKKTGSLMGEHQLVWDPDTEKYVLRNLGTEQMSMFDEEISPDDTYEAEYEDKSGPALLEGSCDDTEDRDEMQMTPFKWLSLFVNRNLKIVESNGNYAVKTDTNEVILTSASSPDSPFHCDAEILAEHEGHEIICSGVYSEATATQSGELYGVEISCLECNDIFFSMYKDEDTVAEDDCEEPCGENAIEEPDEDDSYEYDQPDEA